MRQQVFNRDRRLGRHESVFRQVATIHPKRTDVLVSRFLQHGHLHISEFRDVLRHGIVRTNQSLLDHHHRSDAENRLRGRHHDEDRIPRHGTFCLDIHEAMRLEVNHLAAARNGRDRALDVPCIDVTLHRRIDPLQSLGRHADGLGFRDWNLRTAEREPRESQKRRKPGSQLHRRSSRRHAQDSAADVLCQPNEPATGRITTES